MAKQSECLVELNLRLQQEVYQLAAVGSELFSNNTAVTKCDSIIQVHEVSSLHLAHSVVSKYFIGDLCKKKKKKRGLAKHPCQTFL